MKSVEKALLFVFAVWCLFALPYGYALIRSTTVTNAGNLHAVGVSTDVTNIDWGIITPNETKTQAVTVTNTGNQPVMLSMITHNWNPSLASTYLILTWDYNAEMILPQQSQVIQFSLTASSDVDPSITAFSFDITITGTKI